MNARRQIEQRDPRLNIERLRQSRHLRRALSIGARLLHESSTMVENWRRRLISIDMWPDSEECKAKITIVTPSI